MQFLTNDNTRHKLKPRAFLIPTAVFGLLFLVNISHACLTEDDSTYLMPQQSKFEPEQQSKTSEILNTGHTSFSQWIAVDAPDGKTNSMLVAKNANPEPEQAKGEEPDAAAPDSAAQPEAQAGSSPAGVNLPEPPDGCECTCEEFEAIKDLTARMKSMSQEDMRATATEPENRAILQCMAGCVVHYQQCR